MGSDDAIGPDWGQLLLVCLAICLLALTAAAVPALGGAGPLSVGESLVDDRDSLTDLSDDLHEDAAFEESTNADGDDALDDELADEFSDELPDEDESDAFDDEFADDLDDADEELDDELDPADADDLDDFPDDLPDDDLPDDQLADDEVDDGIDSEADGTAEDEPGADEPDAGDSEEVDDEFGTNGEDLDDAPDNGADGGELDPDEDGEQPTDGDVDDDGEFVFGESDQQDEESNFGVSFADSPTPGETTEATVTEDGEPLEGATVSFDGESVGTTDSDGVVEATVPYTEELSVSIDPDGSSQPAMARGGSGLASAGSPQTASNVTVPIEAETDLAVDDPVLGGSETSVTATINEQPIPDGTVIVDNESVGATGSDGATAVPIPEETDGNVTIAVERGDITAMETVEVRTLSVELTSSVPLPGRTVDVAVTDSHADTDGAPIALDGDLVTTADDGTASVTLPMSGSATIETEVAGERAETTVTGLYRNAAILFGVVGGVGLFTARMGRRRLAESDRSLRALPAQLASRAVSAIVRVADRLVTLGTWLSQQGQTLRSRLGDGLRWLVGFPRAVADRGLAAFAVVNPRALFESIVAWLRSVVSRSQTALERDSTPSSTDLGESSSQHRPQIRSLWRSFLEVVQPPSLETRTPGEIGRYAVDRGLPTEPVETVVDAFRAAEYGDESPTETRLERVKRALSALRERSQPNTEKRGESP